MDVFVKTYRIENGNIQGGKTIDQIPLLDVSEFGEVKKFLEEGATEFRMDSISLKTEFLPKGFFSDYTPQTPYLVEVQVGSGWDAADSRCIFYGPIKEKSIKYDEKTDVTSFEVSSWERSIKQAGTVLARDRVPVKIAREYVTDGIGFPPALDRFWNYHNPSNDTRIKIAGKDDSEVRAALDRGAVLKTKAKIGETSIDYHFTSTSDDFDEGEITRDGSSIYGFTSLSNRIEGLTGSVSTKYGFLPYKHQGPEVGYNAIGKESGYEDVWKASRKKIAVPIDALPGDPKEMVGAEVDIECDMRETREDGSITGRTKSTTTVVKEAGTGRLFQGPESAVQKFNFGVSFYPSDTPAERGEYAILVFADKVAPNDRFLEYKIGISENDGSQDATIHFDVSMSFKKYLTVEQGEEGTLLSSDAYGRGGGTEDPYDAVNISEGLATRIPALADLLDDSPVVRGRPGEISRKFEFDEKAIKALGDIQRSSESHVSFQARSRDGSGGERKGGAARKVKMVVATREYQANQAPIDLPDSIEWKGEVLGAKPDVVVIEGNEIVNVNSDRDNAVGWYPEDAIESPELADEGGKEVVEIEAPLLASVGTGAEFGLEQNTNSLSGRARRYYNFYSQYYREKEVVVDGVFDHIPAPSHDDSILGAVVSENDSVLETGIVTSQSVDYQKEETNLTVLVAENYAAPANMPPVAILSAPEVLNGDGSGSAPIVLDASSSYDPNGDSLSFEWFRNGTKIAGEGSRILDTTVQAGDEITVSVTDPDGATSSDTRAFQVLPPRDAGARGEKPFLSVALNSGASTDTTLVYDVNASRADGDLDVQYEVFAGDTRRDSGEITGPDSDDVVGSVSVDRDPRLELKLVVTVTDTTDGSTSVSRRSIESLGSLSENDLDNFLETNPKSDWDEWAGIYAYRGKKSDGTGSGFISKGIAWNPVSDEFGTVDVDAAFGTGAVTGTFETLVVEDGSAWGIDITGDADTVDGYQGDELAAIAETEIITGDWSFSSTLSLSAASDQLEFPEGGRTMRWESVDAQDLAMRVWDQSYSTSLFEVGYNGGVNIPNGGIDVGGKAIVQGVAAIKGYGDTLLGRQGQHNYITFDKSKNLYFRTYDGIVDGTPLYNNVAWVRDGGFEVDGRIETADYASGWTGTGAAMDMGGFIETTRLDVRGTLLAREFELRKLTFSKGPRADTVGGGKVSEVVTTSTDGNGYYYSVLRFEEPPGLKTFEEAPSGTADYVLAQESDLSDYAGETQDGEQDQGVRGSGYITRQARAHVHRRNGSKEYRVYYVDGNGNRFASQSGYEAAGFTPFQEGDDIMVVASQYAARDSMLFYDPYGPFIDVLDGISDFSQWDSRQPKVRMGWLNGAPNTVGGTQPSGYGLYADNVYLNGHFEVQSGEVRDLLEVGSSVYIGRDMYSSRAPNSIILGAWYNNGDLPIIRAFGDDPTKDYVGLRADTNNWGIEGRVNGDYVFELGSTNQIANWTIEPNLMMRKGLGNHEIRMGEILVDHYGFEVRDMSGGERIRMIQHPDGGAELVAHENDSNFIAIGGDGWQRDEMGITVKSGGNNVFYTDTSTAYIDNLRVRGNAKFGRPSGASWDTPYARYSGDVEYGRALQFVVNQGQQRVYMAAQMGWSNSGGSHNVKVHIREGGATFTNGVADGGGIFPQANGDTASISSDGKTATWTGSWGAGSDAAYFDLSGLPANLELEFEIVKFSYSGSSWAITCGSEVVDDHNRGNINDYASSTPSRSYFYSQGSTRISGGQIVTNSITADKISASAITANEIDVDDLFATNATIDGTFEVNNGIILDSNYNWRLGNTGLSMESFQSWSYGSGDDPRSINWIENMDSGGVVRGSITTGSFGDMHIATNGISPYIYFYPDGQSMMKIDKEEVYISNFLTINRNEKWISFGALDWRDSHPTSSDLSNGEVVIYSYSYYDQNGNINDTELWVARKTNSGVNKNRILD